MSLYHSLETVPIPSIGGYRGMAGSTNPQEELTLPQTEFAPPSSLKNVQESDEDPFIRQKETPSMVQASIPVASVPERIYGQMPQSEKKRLVYDKDEVNV